jgi:hypothetical protein
LQAYVELIARELIAAGTRAKVASRTEIFSEEETAMRLQATVTAIGFAVVLGGMAALDGLPHMSVGVVSAAGRNGTLRITKNCTQYFAAHGAAGQFCTIESSTLPQIPAAATTRVYYDQAFGLPPIGTNGFLDSNVVLYVGSGDWAVGRCTLDGNVGTGLCTFTDGTGSLAGFRARLSVAPLAGADFSWDGPYSFRPDGELEDSHRE